MGILATGSEPPPTTLWWSSARVPGAADESARVRKPPLPQLSSGLLHHSSLNKPATQKRPLWHSHHLRLEQWGMGARLFHRKRFLSNFPLLFLGMQLLADPWPHSLTSWLCRTHGSIWGQPPPPPPTPHPRDTVPRLPANILALFSRLALILFSFTTVVLHNL